MQPKKPAQQNAVRPKAVGASQTRPAAPPVYRPNPSPRVLQQKAQAGVTHGIRPLRAQTTPPAHRPAHARADAGRVASVAARQKASDTNTAQSPSHPQRAHAALQAKTPAGLPRAADSRGAVHTLGTNSVQRKVGARPPGVVQAVKFYPNLHPGAVERVEPGNLFRLESFSDQYRLRKEVGHGAYVPNQQYNFVRTVEGQMLLHNRYRHPSIAEGRQVLYAGEAHFNNGRLQWWSNGSGHYQPDADDAAQAGLPMDQFYTYQQVIKGEHKRKKG